MSILDTTNVSAVMFTADTIVTAPDGNTYTATAGVWWGVPDGKEMTVNLTTPVLCMEAGSYSRRASGDYVQVGTVDSVRTPV